MVQAQCHVGRQKKPAKIGMFGGSSLLKQVILDSNVTSFHHNLILLLHPISVYPTSSCHPCCPQGSCPSPTPSPSYPFTGLPICWLPPPLPAFVAAFVLTPTLWGPAAFLPSCSLSSSSSSLPCAGPFLACTTRHFCRHTGGGLLTPMSGTLKSSHPHPGVEGRSIARERSPALCICAWAFCGDNKQWEMTGQWHVASTNATFRSLSCQALTSH